MEYRKIGDNYYVRMDRGDEIISTLLEICEKESIPYHLRFSLVLVAVRARSSKCSSLRLAALRQSI